MRLLLDVGNSRLKWAWLDGELLVAPGVVAHAGRADAVASIPMPAIPGEILVASVAARSLTMAIAGELHRRWPVPQRFARTEPQGGGVTNAYREPAQMGVDRWLAMVAAWHHRRAAVCVVDAGTALTADLVAADGRHLGGLILPGRELMQRSLLADTGGIAAATTLAPGSEPVDDLLGRDTASCIRAAARRASAGLVIGCMQQWPSALVLTGGDAAALLADLPPGAEHRPLLVLEGLALRLGGATGPEVAV